MSTARQSNEKDWPLTTEVGLVLGGRVVVEASRKKIYLQRKLIRQSEMLLNGKL